MRRFLFFPGLLGLCLAMYVAPSFADDGLFRLTVLHSNDAHSIFGGYAADRSLCYQPRCEGGTGGYVRLHQAVRAMRREAPDALLLDAGDIFQGSLYWTVHKAAMPKALLPFFGYLGIAPGNHEFDDGCLSFQRLFAGSDVPSLAANLAFSPAPDEGGMAGPAPWRVLDIRGRKIGVVGLANPDTPELASPCFNARFSDAAKALGSAVSVLEKQGVDTIIALTHLGLDVDKSLAASVDGVDVIVGGHSHSLLSNSQADAVGPYPVVVASPSGRPVLVVTAASHTRYLGRLDIGFDNDGVPRVWQGDVIPLDDTALAGIDAPAPDPELEALLEAFSVPVRAMLQETVGEISLSGLSGPLERENRLCRQRECLTGNIASDALRAAFPEARIALLNGGAIRNALPAGAVSGGNVLETLPFGGTCMMTTMSGSDIVRALEHGLSGFAEGAGRFLQSSGLRYAFDADAPVGRRVLSVETRDESGAWKALDNNASYAVAVPEYLAKGGDGFTFFRDMTWKASGQSVDELLRGHIERNSPLMPEWKNRTATTSSQ